MENCDKPVADLSVGAAANCIWQKGADSFSAVVHNPGSATINEWAWAILAALVLLNLLLLLLRLLIPRRLP
jgi:hypothetical protein